MSRSSLFSNQATDYENLSSDDQCLSKMSFFFIFPIDVLTMYRLVSSRLYWYDSDSPDGRYISDQDMRKQFSGKKITCFSRVRNFWCVPVKPKPSSGALRDGFRAREKYA